MSRRAFIFPKIYRLTFQRNPSRYGESPGDIISIIGHWTHPPSHVKKKLTNWSYVKPERAQPGAGGAGKLPKHQSSLAAAAAAAAVWKCCRKMARATVALTGRFIVSWIVTCVLMGQLIACMTGCPLWTAACFIMSEFGLFRLNLAPSTGESDWLHCVVSLNQQSH